MKRKAIEMTVERTHRDVIERKLLTALEDDGTVAILASKQDLEDILSALQGWETGEKRGNTLSWNAQLKRRSNLAEGLERLLKEAFPR